MSRDDLETQINSAIGALWESLARVVSTVVSKAILDLEAELKRGRGKVEDRGSLVLKATSHSVKAIKECGLLHPNKTLEVTGVQKNVWKDVDNLTGHFVKGVKFIMKSVWYIIIYS